MSIASEKRVAGLSAQVALRIYLFLEYIYYCYFPGFTGFAFPSRSHPGIM